MSRYYLINNHEYLCGPLSEKEIRDNMNKNNIIEGVVKVHLSNLIDNDLENFLDLISVGLTGSDLLMDISYDILDVSKEEKNMLLYPCIRRCFADSRRYASYRSTAGYIPNADLVFGTYYQRNSKAFEG